MVDIRRAMVESIWTDSTVTITVSSEDEMDNVVNSLLALSGGESDSFTYPGEWTDVWSEDGWRINVVIDD